MSSYSDVGGVGAMDPVNGVMRQSLARWSKAEDNSSRKATAQHARLHGGCCGIGSQVVSHVRRRPSPATYALDTGQGPTGAQPSEASKNAADDRSDRYIIYLYLIPELVPPHVYVLNSN